jgi:HSP20 family protein
MGELLPWGFGRSLLRREEDFPFLTLQREMNRLFDDFWRGFELPAALPGLPRGAVMPQIDVAETDKDIRVTAELPGMEEKDIEVTLQNDMLSIKGEKKREREEKDENYRLVERSFGAFHRTIPLGVDVQQDKIDASFNKGVLTIVLPKSPAALQKAKKIAVKKA